MPHERGKGAQACASTYRYFCDDEALLRERPSRGKALVRLARLGRLVLGRIWSRFCDILSRRGPSRGSPGWDAWSLAKSSEECRGPWQAGPWYPGFHWPDSSPRARDGHARVLWTQANHRGPKETCLARDTWRATATHNPTISAVTAIWWGPPCPGNYCNESIKPMRAVQVLITLLKFPQTPPFSQSTHLL